MGASASSRCRRRSGDWFQRHQEVVIEKLGADAEEFFAGLAAPDTMQKITGHAFAEVVEEFLHAFALDFLGSVEARLRFPEGADVVQNIATGRAGDGFAAQLLADLRKQPRAAD